MTGGRGPGYGPGGPIGIPLSGTGIASDGSVWALYAVGQARELCFEIDIGARGELMSTCPDGSPATPQEDPVRPLVFADPRTPTFVYGRMPADVGEAEVVVNGGRTLHRQRLPPTPVGRCYVLEAPDDRSPVAVIGYRADGTTVRYGI
jgi:hypothetical protein